MVEVSTSVLQVEKENIIKTIYNLEVAHTDYFHIDVMDGEFVKNNNSKLMMEYSEYIKQISNIPLDIHLMVKDVKAYIDAFSSVEPDRITFHVEAIQNENEILKLIQYIKDLNMKVGIAINPNTKIEKIYTFLPYIHTVLIMTVEPGEGGQRLIENTINKIKELKEYVDENSLEVDIQADGGINTENINKVVKAGCNIIVSGNCIINSKNYKETIAKLKKKW